VTPIRIRAATAADVGDPALTALLLAAVDESRTAEVATAAIADGVCLVADEADRIVGCICASHTETGEWTITAVAIADDHRRRGIGRRLVAGAMACSGARSLDAETDGDAVDFYRRLGFSVASLGEKYPGVERFACRWQG